MIKFATRKGYAAKIFSAVDHTKLSQQIPVREWQKFECIT